MGETTPMHDAILLADLDAIDCEVKRRKTAPPFTPYAAWAYTERMSALARFWHRQGLGEHFGKLQMLNAATPLKVR